MCRTRIITAMGRHPRGSLPVRRIRSGSGSRVRRASQRTRESGNHAGRPTEERMILWETGPRPAKAPLSHVQHRGRTAEDHPHHLALTPRHDRSAEGSSRSRAPCTWKHGPSAERTRRWPAAHEVSTTRPRVELMERLPCRRTPRNVIDVEPPPHSEQTRERGRQDKPERQPAEQAARPRPRCSACVSP
mgnify:FL=1